MTSLSPRSSQFPDKRSLRRALLDLFWIGILLPLPIIGVLKAVSALARL